MKTVVCVVSLALSSTALIATSGAAVGSNDAQDASSLRDGQHDFDFEPGVWKTIRRGEAHQWRRVGVELRLDACFAQACDLQAWRRTKQAPIFAAELRRALIPDTIPRGGAFDAIGEHQPPRLVQPQMFLVLQRRHRGNRLEAMV
jgi:hypothetical protein